MDAANPAWDEPPTAPALPADEVHVWRIPLLGSEEEVRGLSERLSAELQAVMRDPETIARWRQLGMIPVGSTSEEFARTIDTEAKRWEAIQKVTGIKLD